MLAQALEPQATREFASDVRRDLGKTPQRELHSKYLYDAVGTALFEVITLLPEYGLTRADDRLIKAHAAEIIERLAAPPIVAELGSGSGRKTRWILEALAKRAYVRVANPASGARNPGFDVTPAELISGIITPAGIFKPKELWQRRRDLGFGS